MGDEVALWPAAKYKSFLQGASIILGVCKHAKASRISSTLPKVPRVTNLQYLCNMSRKIERMKLAFSLQINIKDFFKLMLSF